MRKFSGMKTKIKDRVIRNLAAIAAVAALFFLQGCGKEEVYFSVQDAALLGNVYLYQEIAENGTKKGSPYAVGLEQEGDGVCFTVSIRKNGFYDLDFSASGIGSGKYNIVQVDGAEEGLLYTPEAEGFQECVLQKIYLEKGTHQIELLTNWGWIRLEVLTLRRTKKTQDLVYQVSGALSDPDAGDSAKELMAYMTSIYGKQVLSGQFCPEGQTGIEMQLIRDLTGKQPAILAMDMMNYSNAAPAGVEPSDVIEQAASYWEQGGIVALSWHWYAPEKYRRGQEWWVSLHESDVDMDLEAIFDGKDPEGYQLLTDDLDHMAEQLKRLQDAGAAVLWRPLHEGADGWFWWSRGGAECYKKLWKLMYETFTKKHGLHNLIWIYSGTRLEWYPGDEYVDIAGIDLYPMGRCYGTQANAFLKATELTGGTKPVMLSEYGSLPDPDRMDIENLKWLGCIVWEGQYLTDEAGNYSEEYIEKEALKRFYDSSLVITLDELPKRNGRSQ